MAELMIGALAASGFLLLVRFARVRGLSVSGWQWALSFLGFLYAVFVLEVVVSFLREGSPKGAAVMGTLLGFVAVLWAVLLGRFVFKDSGAGAGAGSGVEGRGINA
jgi:hypothetical protein